MNASTSSGRKRRSLPTLTARIRGDLRVAWSRTQPDETPSHFATSCGPSKRRVETPRCLLGAGWPALGDVGHRPKTTHLLMRRFKDELCITIPTKHHLDT